jgi:NADP-dependent 3-hydroxy acid dehydrogenase YdfG
MTHVDDEETVVVTGAAGALGEAVVAEFRMSADLAARAVASAAITKVIAFPAGPDAAPISGAAIPVYGDA